MKVEMDAAIPSLRQRLGELVMANDTGTLCYANSVFLSALWTILSRKGCQVTDLGPHSEMLQNILAAHQTLNLADQPWFLDLLRDWPEDEGTGQSDSAEFANILLQWVASDHVSCYWEQRVMQGNKTVVHDFGSFAQPITLSVDPELAIDGVLPLRALIRSWHNELGMHQALHDAADTVCVHIDRFCQTAQGTLQKCSLPIGVDWGIEVPVFVDEGIEVTWIDYQVVALTSHLGGTHSGHYQTLLKIDLPQLPQPAISFLHADDNRRVIPCWAPPEAFYQGITMVWMCKCSALDLHQWTLAPAVSEAATRRADMFQMLLS